MQLKIVVFQLKYSFVITSSFAFNNVTIKTQIIYH